MIWDSYSLKVSGNVKVPCTTNRRSLYFFNKKGKYVYKDVDVEGERKGGEYLFDRMKLLNYMKELISKIKDNKKVNKELSW